MTQLFADGERLDDSGVRAVPRESQTSPRHMVRQRTPADEHDALGPGLTAGKGVRAVRCVGCAQATLPRPDDNAPLCARCSDVLADSTQRPTVSFAALWRRKR